MRPRWTSDGLYELAGYTAWLIVEAYLADDRAARAPPTPTSSERSPTARPTRASRTCTLNGSPSRDGQPTLRPLPSAPSPAARPTPATTSSPSGSTAGVPSSGAVRRGRTRGPAPHLGSLGLPGEFGLVASPSDGDVYRSVFPIRQDGAMMAHGDQAIGQTDDLCAFGTCGERTYRAIWRGGRLSLLGGPPLLLWRSGSPA